MVGSRALVWGTVALLVCLSLGCSLFTAVPPTIEMPSATPMPTAPPLVEPTPVASSVPAVCPDRRRVAPPQRSSDAPAGLDLFVKDLEAYLTQGGDPAAVLLLDFEALQQGDLTASGGEEVVYALMDTQSEQIVPLLHLVVFTCRSGQVNQLYRYVPPDGYSLELIAVADMTQDGVADLIFSEFTCGAHTCWHAPYIWSWGGSDFENRMGAEFQFPYPSFELTTTELVVRSVGVGSVGAGPQRPSTTTLAWTGQVITVTAEVLDAPTYRYHAFLDGERALSAGSYEAAAAAYTLAIEDDTLEPWGAFYGAEEERQWLEVLARWRMVILAALSDQPAEAELAFAKVDLTLDAQAPGAPAAVLAQRFRQMYQETGDAVSACAFAINSDAAQPTLDFLNGFGYANPFYELQDLCPSLDFAVE